MFKLISNKLTNFTVASTFSAVYLGNAVFLARPASQD